MSIESMSATNLIYEWTKAINYARRESSPMDARRTFALRAIECRDELLRRAATGDPRYAGFAKFAA